MADQAIPPAIEDAMHRVAQHSHVRATRPIPSGVAGRFVFEVDVTVHLPSKWRAACETPTGVHPLETVTFSFRGDFPFSAPAVFLRADFKRALPHIQPGNPASPIEPCYVDGSPRELLQQRGIDGILDQVVVWLHKAARDELIDHAQGWEPIRRDTLEDCLIADLDSLRRLVGARAQLRFLDVAYIKGKYTRSAKGYAVQGVVHGQPQPLSPEWVEGLSERGPRNEDIFRSRSLAVLVSPGHDATGAPRIASAYLPETVHNLKMLLAQADQYGCRKELLDALGLLRQRIGGRRDKGRGLGPIFVILTARRPCDLIGTTSPLELVPYLLDGEALSEGDGDRVPVYPVALKESATPALLARLSGVRLPAERPSYVQLGAGSLGSKIVLHLGRAGLAPSMIIDKGSLSPHNAARHALTIPRNEFGLDWVAPKAEHLAVIVKGLGQQSQPVVTDVVAWAGDPSQARQHVPKGAALLINSTAALTVREVLAVLPADVLTPRVVETSMFSGGRVGMLTVEGTGRNPNTADLMYEGYAVAREHAQLQTALFPAEGQLGRQEIGQGCGSTTMVVSDARISLFAAAMAERILGWLTDTLPPAGVVSSAWVPPSGFSLVGHTQMVEPFEVLQADNDRAWQIRISPRAHDKIEHEFRRCDAVETGGALIGAVSEARRVVTVIDAVPAPEDSVRETARFVLGKQGLAATLEEYAASTGHSLYCVGTWHSHLLPSGPSGTDCTTAREMAARTGFHALALIITSDGYRSVVQPHS